MFRMDAATNKADTVSRPGVNIRNGIHIK
jgi:hypothetical protein